MTLLNAVFLDKSSLYPDDLDFTTLEAVARWRWFDNADPFEIKDQLEEAEVLVTNKVQINRDLIVSCKRLKLICVAATGVNNVDVDAAGDNGVTVCNVRGYATSSVTQHVFSLIFSLNGKLFSYKKSVLDGLWSKSPYFCYFGESFGELDGKTIGIIGYGELGQGVAKHAQCFGMNVLIAQRDKLDNRDNRVSLTELLQRSDVVSLHCPLTSSNRHIIGAVELAQMKSDAILINTARGGLVDEQALLSALKDKQIGAAGLDVLEEEPPSVAHPLINYHADNLIITPHIAWASQQSRQRLVVELAKNIRAYQEGQVRNAV